MIPPAAAIPAASLRQPCAILLTAARSAALLALLAAPNAVGQRVELLDRIVAVVNADVITRLELDRENSVAQQTLRRQGTPLPQREVLEKQLLERLIALTKI